MEEKILLLRQKLIEELEKLEDGIVIKLDYSKELLERLIFERTEYHKVFALPERVLSKIDFSNVLFDDFDMRKFNSTKERPLHGININPQTIYNKSLYGAKLYGINFIGSFDDAIITGADFTGSSGAKIDPMKLRQVRDIWKNTKFDRFIYKKIDAKNCIFNGVTFTGPFKNNTIKVKEDGNTYKRPSSILITGADFTGSVNALIYLNKVYATYYSYYRTIEKTSFWQSLYGCKLKDATIKGSFEGVGIEGTDFTGAKGDLMFSPQIVYEKNFSNAILNGVTFCGPFDDCNIKGANFTGSYGALINIDKIAPDNLKDVNFTDAKVIGEKKEGLMASGEITIGNYNYEDALTEEINKLLGRPHETELIKKQQLEEARKRLVELNKRKIKEKIKELSQLIQTQAYLGIPESKIYGSIPITQEVFLKKVDNHFEIDEEFIDISLLRFLNLSLIDFTNVKVSGIDFRYTFARIHPQTVYRKDISNCTFDDANVKFFDDFSGVIMDGADFNECDFDTFKIVK